MSEPVVGEVKDSWGGLGPVTRSLRETPPATWYRTLARVDVTQADFLDDSRPWRSVMRHSWSELQRHRDSGTLHDSDGKVAAQVFADLGQQGYWGLRVPREYGGTAAPLAEFYPFLSRMAHLSATVAGLASVHGCIGAAGAISVFGTAEQKTRWLPALARGERFTAFALTEPNTGSDLTAIHTRAERVEDHYEVTGEKLFISNLNLGRLIVLICRIDGIPAALLCDLPTTPTDSFELREYGLHALRRSENRGAVFRGFRVSSENRLLPARGDGLTIAYHGLNRGRVAVCAVAAGQLRTMLTSLMPWVMARRTYGEPLANRGLIRRRLARLAALIVGCDALALWCGELLDSGCRGEAECTVAKVFGSEALKEAAIELMMKTHGGRSFLKGHLWGDNLHDYLTPCIYEGEGEILSLALFRSLAKAWSSSPASPPNLSISEQVGQQNSDWSEKIEFAQRELLSTGQEIRDFLRRSAAGRGPGEHDGQCQMVDWSQRVQKLTVLRVVSEFGASSRAEIERLAAEELTCGLVRELAGLRATEADWARSNRLGEWLVEGGHRHWTSEPSPPILIPGEPASC